MNKELIYDFAVAARCKTRLEESASVIDTTVVKRKDDLLRLTTWAIDCLSVDILLEKCEAFADEMTCVRDELLRCAEMIEQLSQRMRITEEEALRIAAIRETGD